MPTNGQAIEAACLTTLTEPTRLAIVRALATGAKTVTELAKASGVEIVDAARHLSILKDCGLVRTERDGRFMRYNLVGATLDGTTMTLAHASGAKVVIPMA